MSTDGERGLVGFGTCMSTLHPLFDIYLLLGLTKKKQNINHTHSIYLHIHIQYTKIHNHRVITMFLYIDTVTLCILTFTHISTHSIWIYRNLYRKIRKKLKEMVIYLSKSNDNRFSLGLPKPENTKNLQIPASTFQLPAENLGYLY